MAVVAHRTGRPEKDFGGANQTAAVESAWFETAPDDEKLQPATNDAKKATANVRPRRRKVDLFMQCSLPRR